MNPKQRHALFHSEPQPIDPRIMTTLWSIVSYICVLSSGLFRRDTEEDYSIIIGSFKFRNNFECIPPNDLHISMTHTSSSKTIHLVHYTLALAFMQKGDFAVGLSLMGIWDFRTKTLFARKSNQRPDCLLEIEVATGLDQRKVIVCTEWTLRSATCLQAFARPMKTVSKNLLIRPVTYPIAVYPAVMFFWIDVKLETHTICHCPTEWTWCSNAFIGFYFFCYRFFAFVKPWHVPVKTLFLFLLTQFLLKIKPHYRCFVFLPFVHPKPYSTTDVGQDPRSAVKVDRCHEILWTCPSQPSPDLDRQIIPCISPS